MIELLSRQTIIDRFEKRCHIDWESLKLLQPSVAIIENIPESVIHCKNCIHYIPYDWMFSEIWKSKDINDYPQEEIGCELIDHQVTPDDFCSFGECKYNNSND